MDQILVIDVPPGVTAEKAAEMLNAPCESHYLFAIHPANGGSRAFFKARRAPAVPAPDRRHVEAVEMVRRHSSESVRAIQARLRAAGIKRGRTWVWEMRRELSGATAE